MPLKLLAIIALALCASVTNVRQDSARKISLQSEDAQALIHLTKLALKNQKSEDLAYKRLAPIIEQVASDFRTLKDRELTFEKLQRKTKKGILTNKKAKNLYLISHGDVEFKSIRNSILIVHGNLLSRGYIRNSIIICTGKVQSDHYLRESIVISLGKVRSKRYIRDSLIEAPAVQMTDYSRDNIYRNSPKAPKNGKRDRHITRPSRLFKTKKPKLY